jgi:hypothetical protein
MATTVNAWVFPGNLADRAYFSDIGHFRTEVGLAWTMAVFFRLDTISPGEDGFLFSLRRSSNGAINHGFRFNDGIDNLVYLYNLGSEQASTGASSVAATTWYLGALTYPGTGTSVTLRLISAAGSQLGSGTGTATSNYDDGQTQEITLGAHYDGSVTSFELRGRVCLPLFILGTALSQSELEGYAADPLNDGDDLLATHGSAMVWFDDSSADVSVNGETLTLAGGVTLGSANGPSVTDRATPASPGPGIDLVGDLDIIFEGEINVAITGSNFGAAQGAGNVWWNNTDTLNGNEVQYSGQISWSDTLILLGDNVDLDDLLPGALYIIVEADGGLIGAKQILIKATPDQDEVGIRTTPDAQTVITGTAFSFDASDYAFHANAQESLTWSIFTGTLPDGLTLSAIGLMSGTISFDAVSGSVEIRAVDPSGDQASDGFSYTILAEPVDPGPANTARSQAMQLTASPSRAIVLS